MGTSSRQTLTIFAISSELAAGCAATARHEPAPRDVIAPSGIAKAATASPGQVDAGVPLPTQAAQTSENDDAKKIEACPDHSAEPSNDSPSYLVDDLGELYQGYVTDYLDVFGRPEQPIVDIGAAQRRRAVCAALGSEGYKVFELAQSGKKFQARAPENCVGQKKQEFRMGRIIWEFSKLPNGKYLATRTARTGSPLGLLYQGHGIETSIDGPFVVTVATSEAWRCPHDPTDPCELHTDDERPEVPAQVLCALDQMTPCSHAGVTSDVYVTDYRTRATAHFGWFYRRPRPTIKIDAKQIEVAAGNCTQTAPLPLVVVESH
jgi:hypothetical protein